MSVRSNLDFAGPKREDSDLPDVYKTAQPAECRSCMNDDDDIITEYVPPRTTHQIASSIPQQASIEIVTTETGQILLLKQESPGQHATSVPPQGDQAQQQSQAPSQVQPKQEEEAQARRPQFTVEQLQMLLQTENSDNQTASSHQPIGHCDDSRTQHGSDGTAKTDVSIEASIVSGAHPPKAESGGEGTVMPTAAPTNNVTSTCESMPTVGTDMTALSGSDTSGVSEEGDDSGSQTKFVSSIEIQVNPAIQDSGLVTSNETVTAVMNKVAATKSTPPEKSTGAETSENKAVMIEKDAKDEGDGMMIEGPHGRSTDLEQSANWNAGDTRQNMTETEGRRDQHPMVTRSQTEEKEKQGKSLYPESSETDEIKSSLDNMSIKADKDSQNEQRQNQQGSGDAAAMDVADNTTVTPPGGKKVFGEALPGAQNTYADATRQSESTTQQDAKDIQVGGTNDEHNITMIIIY